MAEETRGGVRGYSDPSASATSEGEQGTGSGSPASTGTTTDSSSPGGDQGTGGSQSPFTHQLLRSATNPQQVDAIVSVLEQTVREQGAALNAVARGNTQAPPAAPPAPERESPALPTKEIFWEDPVAATTSVTENVVTRVLREQLSPLVEELRSARSEIVQPNLWQRLREDKGEFPHFAAAEQGIRAYLQHVGKLDTATEGDIREAYFRVVGWMFQNNLLSPEKPTSTNTPAGGGGAAPNQGNVIMFPQHAASSQPLPSQPAGGGGGTGLRDLTENERRLAAIQFPGKPYAEQQKLYLAWIDVPAADVVNSNIGREGQK